MTKDRMIEQIARDVLGFELQDPPYLDALDFNEPSGEVFAHTLQGAVTRALSAAYDAGYNDALDLSNKGR